jgi:hypothetical protein
MKGAKKLPSLKKEIKDFLLSEEGKISKKDIAKIGVSLAAISLLFLPEAQASHDDGYGHNNYLFDDGVQSGHNAAYTHGSHTQHSSW